MTRLVIQIAQLEHRDTFAVIFVSIEVRKNFRRKENLQEKFGGEQKQKEIPSLPGI